MFQTRRMVNLIKYLNFTLYISFQTRSISKRLQTRICVCKNQKLCECCILCMYVCVQGAGTLHAWMYAQNKPYFCKLQTQSRMIQAFEIGKSPKVTFANLHSCLQNQKLANVMFSACMYACRGQACCMHVCMQAGMHACMCVYMHACMYVYCQRCSK
jgi:hypothetical protein